MPDKTELTFRLENTDAVCASGRLRVWWRFNRPSEKLEGGSKMNKDSKTRRVAAFVVGRSPLQRILSSNQTIRSLKVVEQ